MPIGPQVPQHQGTGQPCSVWGRGAQVGRVLRAPQCCSVPAELGATSATQGSARVSERWESWADLKEGELEWGGGLTSYM